MPENFHEEQLKSSIAKALIYSDIFSYPLTAEEVYDRLSTNHTCVEEVKQILENMRGDGMVFQFGKFFAIRNEQYLEERRVLGNRRAEDIMPTAIRRGKFLAKFPFIRSVMISGSLSKNYMDDDSDVDYFVITTPGRLWVAKFFVAAFKRIFLRNSHRLFCVNYYIDSRHLEIEEKNIFTATELATLIPVSGGEDYARLIESNSWVRDYFPNRIQTSELSRRPLKSPWLKGLAEAIINPIGDRIDTLILRLAMRRYKKLYGHAFNSTDFGVAFKSRKDVSKNHERHFQKHVTELFENKIKRFHQDHRQPIVA